MPQQFLHCANIASGFQKMRGKRVPQGVRTRRLMDPRSFPRPLHSALNRFFLQMMPALNIRLRVDCCRRGWKNILPPPFPPSARVLSRKCMR